MNPIIRNVLAVIAGLVVGSIVNMGIINLGGSIISPPGAIIAGLLAAAHKMKFALSIGLFFMIGGIINVFMLPSPLWFNIADLVGAYIPMGWIGGKIVTGKK